MLLETLFGFFHRWIVHRPGRYSRRHVTRRRCTSYWPALEALERRIMPASLSIGDVTIVEGNDGFQYALVSVNLDGPSHKTVTVKYATADGTAKAGADYSGVSGMLTFARGETSKTIAVAVHGDRVAELDEFFTIMLSGAQHASIRDGKGVVTIVEDEPRISIGDASGTVVSFEGSTTGTTLYFKVSLAVAYDETVTLDYATADGTPVAGVDYVAISGTLTFAPGETTKTVAVQVTGNSSGQTEWFSINLSGASDNAQIVDSQGIGTIFQFEDDICNYVCCHPDGCGDSGDPYGIAP